MNTVFFSTSGSTYRYRRISLPSLNTGSTRFRVCMTVSILEHLHEVNFNLCILLIYKTNFRRHFKQLIIMLLNIG